MEFGSMAWQRETKSYIYDENSMIIDTHAHYDDEAFDEDREELLGSFLEHGIEAVVNVGASIMTSKHAIALTEKYDFVYGAVGVHPNEASDLTEEDMEWLRTVSAKDKIVAIGETGLDYYWNTADKETQKKWFVRQLQLAKEVQLPVIIHSRDAAKDTLDIMKEQKSEEIGGVVHCFSYGVDMAREYLNMGFYLGIGGVITFKNARRLKEVVEYAPMDRLVLETDSPYLTPVPYRGKRNNSKYLPFVVEEIAAIKGISTQDVIERTKQNALNMYRMEDIYYR